MKKNQPDAAPAQHAEMVQKAQGQEMFKSQNPNRNHNTKKESLGPNTKR